MPVCVVVGAGPGTGAACARRFAQGGHRAALVARTEDKVRELAAAIPGAIPVAADCTDEASVASAFARVRRELGPVDVLIQNAGNAVFGGFDQITPAQLEDAWRTNVLGLFLCAREAVADMRARGAGTIVVTGATASLRGGAPFAAFAPAKAGQRSLAQSMARSLGPAGIHVATIIIDGVVDMPLTRQFFKDRPDDFFLRPDAIAESVWHLAMQPRSAWTFELDVRPFGEKW
jgi:NAD(P)-dependent dehydrogenase (short-subunit alcohol dehydrogenase family)